MSRFILPAALALGLSGGFLTPAQAHEEFRHEAYHREIHHTHAHRCFEVLYRCDPREAWRCSGRFDCREDARCAQERLERQGFFTRIRVG